jgi:hypothetical protein
MSPNRCAGALLALVLIAIVSPPALAQSEVTIKKFTNGQDANLGTVTATLPSEGAVIATDPSHYYGSTLILRKHTNGLDADIPPGPTLAIGSAVNWTYEVSNPVPRGMRLARTGDVLGPTGKDAGAARNRGPSPPGLRATNPVLPDWAQARNSGPGDIVVCPGFIRLRAHHAGEINLAELDAGIQRRSTICVVPTDGGCGS